MLTPPLPSRFAAPIDDSDEWLKAKADALAEKLQRATMPLRDQVRDICVTMLDGTMLTEEFVNALRPLLRTQRELGGVYACRSRESAS